MEPPYKYPKPIPPLERVREDGLALRNMRELNDNHEIVMAAVRQNGNAIAYASDNLKRTREIILAALKTDDVFKLLPPDIRANREYLLRAVATHSPQFYQNLQPAALRNDDEVVMAYISGIENATSSKKKFRDVPPQFRSNPRFVLAAANRLSDSLSDVTDPTLLVNRNFAINCIQANWGTLRYFPAFQDDTEVVSQAIAIDGIALRDASPRLKQDREFVIRAIRQNSQALYYADNVLKNDEAIVRLAMEEYPYAILYTSEQFQREHHELIRNAMIRKPDIWYSLPPFYQQDISILQLIPPRHRTEQQKELLRKGTDVFNITRKVTGVQPRIASRIQQMLGTNPRMPGGTRKNRKKKEKKKINKKITGSVA